MNNKKPTGMTIQELIKIADSHYVEIGMIQNYFDHPDENHGDGLAKFIYNELQETFDEDSSDPDKINEAIHVLGVARLELDNVIAGLNTRLATLRSI